VSSPQRGGVNLTSSTPADASGKEITSADFVKEHTSNLDLGTIIMSPFGVDETENKYRYLNGQILSQDQFAAFTTKVKSWQSTRASLFTTETNWQAEKTNSKLGQCGKFVVNDTAGTIRLPCVVNMQGLVDLAQIGVIKSETLPNVVSKLGGLFNGGSFVIPTQTSGVRFVIEDNVNCVSQYSTRTANNTVIDASLSSSTYQDNAPVQQEAIQYPYAIVVNTGVKEAEHPINNYQVNNVYSYGMSQYYKGTMNNNSWLKSAGQWNDGTVYTGMYNWLLEQMNAGVSGVVASTATYTDYDFVINTTDQTFRLPLLNGEENLPGNKCVSISLSGTTSNFVAPANGFYAVSGIGFSWVDIVNTTSGKLGVCSQPRTADGFGRYTIFAKTGDQIVIYCGSVPTSYTASFIYAQGNGNLYYYIGDTLQNAHLINVARIEEKLTDMNAASRGYLVETYQNGDSWYRVYSDGWIEQGGNELDGTTTYPLSHSVTFLKPFNTLLSLSISMRNAANAAAYNAGLAAPATTTGFKVTGCYNGTSEQNAVSWYACGY